MGHGSVYTECWAVVSLLWHSTHLPENTRTEGFPFLPLSWLDTVQKKKKKKVQCLILRTAVIYVRSQELLIRKHGIP